MPGKFDYPLGYKQKDIKNITATTGKAAKSAHSVITAKKHSHPEKLRFAKPHKPRQLQSNVHELEATVSDFYRFLLGSDRAPKTRVIKRYGVLSTGVEGGYLSYHEADCKGDARTSAEELVKRGMGSILAANYLMEENDCHWGNFGFNGAGKLARIDFDQSIASITFGEGIKCVSGGPPTQFSFSKIDAYDLNHLANPRTFQPYNAPLHMAHGSKAGATCFLSKPWGLKIIAAEARDHTFQFDKWKTLIKAALLSPEDIEKTFGAHFTDPLLIDQYSKLIHKRFQTIFTTLTQLPEFQAFFLRNEEKLFTAVQDDINAYNQEFKKHPARLIKIDYRNTIFNNIYEAQERQAITAKEQALAEQKRAEHEKIQQELARIQAEQEVRIREHQEKLRMEAEQARIAEARKLALEQQHIEEARKKLEIERQHHAEQKRIAEEKQKIAAEQKRLAEEAQRASEGAMLHTQIDALPSRPTAKMLPKDSLQLPTRAIQPEPTQLERMRAQQEYIRQQDQLFEDELSRMEKIEKIEQIKELNQPSISTTKQAASSQRKNLLSTKLCAFAKQFSPIPTTPLLMNVTEFSKLIEEARTTIPQITNPDELHTVIRSISIILNNIQEREKNIAEERITTIEQKRTYQRELSEIDGQVKVCEDDITTMQKIADQESKKIKSYSYANSVLHSNISKKKRLSLADIAQSSPEITAIAKELNFEITHRNKVENFFHKIYTKLTRSPSDKAKLLALIERDHLEKLLPKCGKVTKTLERFKAELGKQHENRNACLLKIQGREANEDFISRQQTMLTQPEILSLKGHLNRLKVEAQNTLRALAEPRATGAKPPRAPKLIGGRHKH